MPNQRLSLADACTMSPGNQSSRKALPAIHSSWAKGSKEKFTRKLIPSCHSSPPMPKVCKVSNSSSRDDCLRTNDLCHLEKCWNCVDLAREASPGLPSSHCGVLYDTTRCNDVVSFPIEIRLPKLRGGRQNISRKGHSSSFHQRESSVISRSPPWDGPRNGSLDPSDPVGGCSAAAQRYLDRSTRWSFL